MDLSPPPLPPYTIPAMISEKPAPSPKQIEIAANLNTSHLSDPQLLGHEENVLNWGSHQVKKSYCSANGVPPVRPVFDVERPEGTLRFGVCASSLRTIPVALLQGAERLTTNALQVAGDAILTSTSAAGTILGLPADLIRGIGNSR